MTEQKMRCPFRKNENGDFAQCYGTECMAYLEYDQPVYRCSEKENHPVHVTGCRMMMQPVFYNGCAG